MYRFSCNAVVYLHNFQGFCHPHIRKHFSKKVVQKGATNTWKLFPVWKKCLPRRSPILEQNLKKPRGNKLPSFQSITRSALSITYVCTFPISNTFCRSTSAKFVNWYSQAKEHSPIHKKTDTLLA